MALTVDLANPDIYVDGTIVLPRETSCIVRTKFLWRGVLNERIGFRNFADKAAAPASSLFCRRFRDLFEVRGSVREKRGEISDREPRPALYFVMSGLDGSKRRSIVSSNRCLP